MKQNWDKTKVKVEPPSPCFLSTKFLNAALTSWNWPVIWSAVDISISAQMELRHLTILALLLTCTLANVTQPRNAALTSPTEINDRKFISKARAEYIKVSLFVYFDLWLWSKEKKGWNCRKGEMWKRKDGLEKDQKQMDKI